MLITVCGLPPSWGRGGRWGAEAASEGSRGRGKGRGTSKGKERGWPYQKEKNANSNERVPSYSFNMICFNSSEMDWVPDTTEKVHLQLNNLGEKIQHLRGWRILSINRYLLALDTYLVLKVFVQL